MDQSENSGAEETENNFDSSTLDHNQEHQQSHFTMVNPSMIPMHFDPSSLPLHGEMQPFPQSTDLPYPLPKDFNPALLMSGQFPYGMPMMPYPMVPMPVMSAQQATEHAVASDSPNSSLHTDTLRHSQAQHKEEGEDSLVSVDPVPIPTKQPCKCGYFVDTRVFTARPPIQCTYCHSLYHFECIDSFKKFNYDVLLGDDFFQYKCARCSDGTEVLKRMSMSWPDILHLAIFHLTHSGYPTDHVDGPARFYQIKQDICPVIEENWTKFWTKIKSDTWTNSIASALSTSTPHRFLSGKSHHGLSGWWAITNPFVYPSTYEQKRIRTPQYDILEDGSFIRIGGEKLKRPKPSTEENVPEKNKKTRVKNSSEPKQKKIAKKKKDVDDRPVTLMYLDIPDLDETVQLSTQTTHTARQFHVDKDGLTAYNSKGYRTCKSTHGVTRGCWFFEVEILSPKTEDGNLRIGWSQISGDLQAPCGFDAFGYSFRASPASIFHESRGTAYGTEYIPGDVLGVMINLPEDGTISEECDPLPSPWNPVKSYEQVQYFGDRPILQGSEIRYFLNGTDLGVAFKDIYYGKYHAAISSYMGGCVHVNFGDTNFKYPPPTQFYGYRAMGETRFLCPPAQPQQSQMKQEES